MSGFAGMADAVARFLMMTERIGWALSPFGGSQLGDGFTKLAKNSFEMLLDDPVELSRLLRSRGQA